MMSNSDQLNSQNPLPTHLQRSLSADTSHRHVLMTHISSLPSFQRRTIESARQLRDNINNVIRPLVETTTGVQSVASDFRNYLNRPQSEPNVSRVTSQNSNDNFVINLDDTVNGNEYNDNNQNNDGLHSVTVNLLNEPPPPDNNNAEDANNNERSIEFQEFLKLVGKFIPFISILLAKAIYDYHRGLFLLIILLLTFAHSNTAVVKETTKRHRRSLLRLSRELFYIIVCLAFTYYMFKDELQNDDIILHLVFISTFKHPLSVGYLLWVLMVTDFVLKLITIIIKIVLTMLPSIVLQFQKRGKFYLFIEAVSQLYRSTATIQPWLYYFLESYHGPEKIVAVFLSAFYMISKGSDLMSKVRLFRNAFFKLLQNVSVGSSPSKEEIQSAGEHCAICHDEYDSPVLLHCRHIFCEGCVTTWFDREQTCPLCRTKIVDDPSWRDGSTTYFLQLF